MITFKYQFTDIGYCRVCFALETDKSTLYYCLQEEGNTIELYRCADNDYWEPQSACTIKPEIAVVFAVPEDLDSYANNMITEWQHQRKQS